MTTFRSKIMASLLALGLLLVPVSAFAQYYFWWQVADEFGRPFPSQTISCSVYELASHGAAVIYNAPSLAPHAGVQTSMPLLSDSNSRLHFYSASSDDKRVVCYYARGGAATDVRLSRTVHTILIDRQGRKIVRFPYVTNTGTTRTGIWFPRGAIIYDLLVQNVSNSGQTDAPASDVNPEPHLNVGFAGEHVVSLTHSLVNRMHLTRTAEWVRPGPRYRTVTKAGGSGQLFHVIASHRGEALADTCGRGGVSGPPLVEGCTFYFERPMEVHFAGGLEVTYNTSNTPGISGHVYLLYESFHTGLSTSPVYQQ